MRLNPHSSGLDMFIYGKSGAGKDTVANYLKDYFKFRQGRLAETIKRILCERYDMTFDELEEAKRTNEEIRKAHWEVGDYLGKQASINRLNQLATRRAYDYNKMGDTEKAQQIVIFDVRDKIEAENCLKNGMLGIFLTRTTSEQKDGQHWTEDNMFTNGDFMSLATNPDYEDRIIVIFNGKNNKTEYKDYDKIIEDIKTKTKIADYGNLIIANGATEAMLLECIDTALIKYAQFIEEQDREEKEDYE